MKKTITLFLFLLLSSTSIAYSQDNVQTFEVNGVSFSMIYVEGGTFTMGATEEQGPYNEDDEKPAHQVSVSSFYIGQTEVTQELWLAVTGTDISHFKGAKRPVENVRNWDIKDFLKKLNAMTGKTFRLPTEAEWEFAARGGKKSMICRYSGSNILDEVAWYSENSYNQTHDVATKNPNELGLYDMTGNVSEFCQDKYDKKYYKKSPVNNPKGPNEEYGLRVVRGGNWSTVEKWSYLSYRNHDNDRTSRCGFRLVLDVSK